MIPVIPIFYVDDDSDDLAIFAMAAKTLQIETRLFNCGEDIINALINPPPAPSVIFIDINMPRISGYEVIGTIKETAGLSNIPIIVLTTGGNETTVQKCRDFGVDYFVQKPPCLSALIHAIGYVTSLDWNKHDPVANFVHQHIVP